MKQQLTTLKSIIDVIDNDPMKSMSYYTTALKTTNSVNCPHPKVRQQLIEEILHKTQHEILQNGNCEEVDITIQPIFDGINFFYSFSQHLCWKSHEHHFHTNFIDYVNCPVTCLAEISEFIDKMIKWQS